MTTSPDRITPAALATLMASATPHAVLDVRERGAYERGHVFRATALPRRLLEVRLPALVTAPATPLVLIDADGGALAARARTTALALGYRDVRVLEGGLAAWRAEGRRTVQGINVPSKVFGERALHQHKTPQIPPVELATRIARGDDMVIVDTRTPEEYARGCVPGAISMPGGELVFRILELVKRADQPIVVHCGGRTRSLHRRRVAAPHGAAEPDRGPRERHDGLGAGRARRWSAAPAGGRRRRPRAAGRRRRWSPSAWRPRTGSASSRPRSCAGCWRGASERNAYLLDVRTREEYAAGHIAGAVWVPGGQAVQATDECIAVRESTIVLADDSFARATLTAAWLKRMGFPDVAVLAGGLPAWVAAGGATETGHPVPLPAGLDAARATVTTIPPGDLGDAAGHRRGPERRLCARPRAGSHLGLPQPAGGSHRRRRAGPRAGRGGDVRRRGGLDAGRRHAGRARLPGARPRRRNPGVGGGRAAARDAAPPGWPTSPTTSCPSPTSAGARPWKPTSHGRKRSTTRA